MLEQLSREDTPDGLPFSLGFRVEPGSSLIFIRSSSARAVGATAGSFHEQLGDSLRFIKRAAASVSSDATIAKVRYYLSTSSEQRGPFGGREYRNPRARAIWAEIIGTPLTASTSLQVPGSPLLGSFVDVEAWAIAPSASLSSEIVRVPGDDGVLPTAVAVRGEHRLCVAAVRPEPSDHVEAELLSCLTQIRQRFAERAAGPDDVLKLTVYYRDPRSWPMIESVVAGMFAGHCPVVNGVVTSNMRTPDGHVEVTGWARCGAADDARPRSGSATVDLKDRLLVTTGSGALPIFSGGQASQMYKHDPPPTIEEQAHLGMANQKAVLESAGASFADVFRSNWYLTDMRDWDVVEPIISSYFPNGSLPVPMAAEVSRLTAKQGVRIEPDLWAALPAAR